MWKIAQVSNFNWIILWRSENTSYICLLTIQQVETHSLITLLYSFHLIFLFLFYFLELRAGLQIHCYKHWRAHLCTRGHSQTENRNDASSVTSLEYDLSMYSLKRTFIFVIVWCVCAVLCPYADPCLSCTTAPTSHSTRIELKCVCSGKRFPVPLPCSWRCVYYQSIWEWDVQMDIWYITVVSELVSADSSHVLPHVFTQRESKNYSLWFRQSYMLELFFDECIHPPTSVVRVGLHI